MRTAALYLATGLAVAPAGAMELVYDGGGPPVLGFSSMSGSIALPALEVAKADPWFDNGIAGINLQLSDAASTAFGALTSRSVGQVMTLSVCGDDLLSATVQAAIESGAIGVTTEGLGTAVWYARVLGGEIGCDGKPAK